MKQKIEWSDGDSLIGRTIVSAEMYDLNPVHDWSEHEVFYLTLDDGRVVRFGGWGYDACGGTAEIVDDR